MNKARMFLTGVLKYHISGQDCYRFLALCSANHIVVNQMIKSSDGIDITVSHRDREDIVLFQKKCNVKAVMLAEYGLPFLLQKFRKRNLYFLGLLMTVLVCILTSKMIWKIEIEGNFRLTDATVRRFLAEQHVFEGILIKTVDTEKLEQKMREDFKEINWISIGFDHTHMKVHIAENETRYYENSNNDRVSDKDLLAPYDCKIESIIVRNGTATVKKGDEVSAGTVMVKGEVEIFNDDGTVREKLECTADADILLSYHLKIRESVPRVEILKQYTGRNKSYLKCYYQNHMLWQSNQSDFKYYDQISQWEGLLYNLEKWGCPLQMEFVKQREFLPLEKNHTNEELQQVLNQKIHIIIETLAEKGVQIIEKNGTMNNDADLLVYVGDWEVQELVSRDFRSLKEN